MNDTLDTVNKMKAGLLASNPKDLDDDDKQLLGTSNIQLRFGRSH